MGKTNRITANFSNDAGTKVLAFFTQIFYYTSILISLIFYFMIGSDKHLVKKLQKGVVLIKAKEYEVLRFIEHDGKCRIIMDCASGVLLIHKLKECSRLEKETVLNWCILLTGELEKYHRSKKRQCYRYLNPYSVLVTTENKILLLDLNARDNGFVMQKAQSPAMREHFLKSVVLMKADTGLEYDLYSLGKTIQFLLANTEADISLSRREVFLLSGIIEKCLGENPKKKYENLKQLQKELTHVNPRKILNYKKPKKRMFWK